MVGLAVSGSKAYKEKGATLGEIEDGPGYGFV